MGVSEDVAATRGVWIPGLLSPLPEKYLGLRFPSAVIQSNASYHSEGYTSDGARKRQIHSLSEGSLVFGEGSGAREGQRSVSAAALISRAASPKWRTLWPFHPYPALRVRPRVVTSKGSLVREEDGVPKPLNTTTQLAGCERHLLHRSFLGSGVDSCASLSPNALQLLGRFYISSNSV